MARRPRKAQDQYPQSPEEPQYSQPQYPEEPQYPQEPRYPQEPQYPGEPQYPQEPREPQYPQEPQYRRDRRYPAFPPVPRQAPPLNAPWGTNAPSPPPPPGGAGFPPPGGGPTPVFPILTEELGVPPSPVANIGSGSSASSTTSGRGNGLGTIAMKALQDVLGWKIKPGDSKGFVGALNQSFQLKTIEGHVEAKWTPRSYAVSSDLSGGITGAQASIYSMAKTLLDQALPLIDGLYPLDPAADDEYIDALKKLANSQLTQLVNELGSLGGPKVARVHQYFQMLLGIRLTIHTPANPSNPPTLGITLGVPAPGEPAPPPPTPHVPRWTDPEQVLGTLGDIRDELGLAEIASTGHPSYINTVDDEQNVTNFRILVDYTNSLLTSWQNSFRFFIGTTTPFLGTQLVFISRQLSVVAEAVNELRFVLDSVFIGPSERETFLLAKLPDSTPNIPRGTVLPPIFIEDLLTWVQGFVTDEAPGIIQSGGKFAMGEDFSNVVWQLCNYTYGAYLFAQGPTGSAISTERVLVSLSKLTSQLYVLYTAAYPVGVPYLAPRA